MIPRFAFLKRSSSSTTARQTAERQVRAVFRALLQRDPDPAAEELIRELQVGSLNLEDLIKRVTLSEEYREPPGRAAHNFIPDHSQFGELAILLRLWIGEYSNHRLVVDVGTRGRQRSNAYDLLKSFGWRGLLIEANPYLIENIREDFAGLDFELLECAVSDHSGEAVFHLGVNDDVSSLDPEAAAGWGPLAGVVKVNVRRLVDCLTAQNIPLDFDLLSIDIEGQDVRVLNDLVGKSDYRPRWVIIEASYNFQTRRLADLPLCTDVLTNYSLVAQTSANLMLRCDR